MSSGDWIGSGIINAVFAVGNVVADSFDTNQRVAAWTAPTRCRLLDVGDTTRTAAVSASIYGATVDTTSITDIMLRNLTANTTGVDMLGTAITLQGVTDDSAEAVMDGVAVTTESSLIVEQGETVVIDLDDSWNASGTMVINAYFVTI